MPGILPDELALTSGFPTGTREQWRKLVDQVLQGADFDSTLVTKAHDGVRIEPLTARKPSPMPISGRAPGSSWTVVQRIDHPEPSSANSEAMHDLANGAAGLALEFTGAVGAYGFGLPAEEHTLSRALEGIDFGSGIVVDLDLGAQPNEAVELLASLVERRGTQPGASKIQFGLDPIGAAAATGGSRLGWMALGRELTDIITGLAKRRFRGPFAVADGRIVHNAGGSEPQELAYVLAVALAYLRALEAAGIGLDAARRMIYFRLAADADQFLSMSKFRALRKLWARVEAACGLTPTPAVVAADTAWRMMTRRDPYVNVLRTTIAVVAAGLGGADAITALPFTMALGLPDRFARRLARNSQLVLLEESNLARVGDPAAGSGTIEDMTEQLCRAAWLQFQQIEAVGGAFAALEREEIQRNIAAVQAQRRSAVALRSEVITGTTDFVDLSELPVSVAEWPPAPFSRAAEGQFEPLVPLRLAQPFEELRDASDQMLLRTGARPKVFLANLGSTDEFGPRAAFSSNLFQAGGIEVVSSDGFATPEEMIIAYQRSDTPLACFCSSDEFYRRQGQAVIQSLRAAGAAVWVAGRAQALPPTLETEGICGFIFAGCDVLAALRAAHSLIATREGLTR
jgi:methylmalonyl-CoA mutase